MYTKSFTEIFTIHLQQLLLNINFEININNMTLTYHLIIIFIF